MDYPIHVRDMNVAEANILADPVSTKYYMYANKFHIGLTPAERKGTGETFYALVSEDLIHWSNPVLVFEQNDFWGSQDYQGPECFLYEGKYYLLAAFSAPGRFRKIQALVADSPLGPFAPWGEPLSPAGCWGAAPPLNSWFRKGKVAVRPSSSSPSPSSLWGWFIRPSRPSAPPKADIISVVRLSRSSSLMPIFFIISSMGLMPSSLAHFRHRPSFLVVPFSILVIKITATFLPQRLHIIFGCIHNIPFGKRGFQMIL